jgi:hypothetical protein
VGEILLGFALTGAEAERKNRSGACRGGWVAALLYFAG